MPKEITILHTFPVILTQDAEFVQRMKEGQMREGNVVLLPEDAVLVVPPEIMSVESAKISSDDIIPGQTLIKEKLEKPEKESASTAIMIVDKTNWKKFKLLSAEEQSHMSYEERKEYKRQYSKYYYYKTKEEKELGDRPAVAKGMIAKEEVPEAPRDYHDLPMDMVNSYGLTAVEVVLAEKNRGIGFTADEIFEMRDKRLKNLSLEHVTEIYEALEEQGL